MFATSAAKSLRQNPQPIPGYQMIRVLGQGGMGSVMLARSVNGRQAVAIKTLLPEVAVSEQSLKRFMREIEVASSLRHPNIVSYIEHGTHNGIIYLVTEYISGMDAARLAKSRGGKLDYTRGRQHHRADAGRTRFCRTISDSYIAISRSRTFWSTASIRV